MAHFTRMGNSRNARHHVQPFAVVGGKPVGVLAFHQMQEAIHQLFAPPRRVRPVSMSVISEAEAWLMAQPLPSNLMSAMRPSASSAR